MMYKILITEPVNDKLVRLRWDKSVDADDLIKVQSIYDIQIRLMGQELLLILKILYMLLVILQKQSGAQWKDGQNIV